MKIWLPVVLIGQFLECQLSLGFCAILSINCTVFSQSLKAQKLKCLWLLAKMTLTLYIKSKKNIHLIKLSNLDCCLTYNIILKLPSDNVVVKSGMLKISEI